MTVRGNVRLNVRSRSGRGTFLGAGLGPTPLRREAGLSVTTSDERAAQENPWPRPERRFELSQELLDRAHVGWELFLDTFEGAFDD